VKSTLYKYKSIIIFFGLILAIGLLLRSNYWQKVITQKANQSLSSIGWKISIQDTKGHLLGNTKFLDVKLYSSDHGEIFVNELNFNLGILSTLFNRTTIEVLFAESVSINYPDRKTKTGVSPIFSIFKNGIPINIKSFYITGELSVDIESEIHTLEAIMNGELEGGPNPKIYFDLCKIDLPMTPFVDIDLNTIEISYADSNFYLHNLAGSLAKLPLSGKLSIDQRESLLKGEININNFSIPDELFSKIPLKAKFSNFSGTFDFETNMKNSKGKVSLKNNLGLDMFGEFNLVRPDTKSWVLKKLSLEGEKTKLNLSGLINKEGRFNSYLNLEKLDFSRFIDNAIGTDLTGLAILDGSISPNGILEKIHLTLEILETEYFEQGDVSFHGQVIYEDSTISTINQSILFVGNSEMSLDGSFDFSDNKINLFSELQNADIKLVNQFLPGEFDSGISTGKMRINGPYNSPSVMADLVCTDIIYNDFYLESIQLNSKIEVADQRKNGEVALKLGNGNWRDKKFDSGTIDIILDDKEVIIENCHFKSGSDFLQFSGSFDGYESYLIDQIKVVFENNYLVNADILAITVFDSVILVDPFEFHINDGILEGIAKGGLHPIGRIKMSNFDASIITYFFPDERLNLSGIVFGEILAEGYNGDYEFDVDLSLKKGQYMDQKFDEMTLSFLYTDAILHMDDISMTKGNTMGFQANGIIPIGQKKMKNIPISITSTFTNLPLNLVEKYAPDFFNLKGFATGSLQLNGTPIQTGFSYDIDITDGAFDNLFIGDISSSGKYDGIFLNIDTLYSTSTKGEIIASGMLPFDLNVASESFGELHNNELINFKTNGKLKSLFFLSPYIKDLDSLSGDIEINLILNGLIHNIQKSGDISIRNGIAYSVMVDDPITNIEGEARMLNNKLSISTLNAKLYHPGINYSKPKNENVKVEGLIDLEDFFSPNYFITINAENASFKTLPVDIVGLCNLDINITGKDTIKIDGTVETMDAKIFYEFNTKDIGESYTDVIYPVMVYNILIPIQGEVLFQNSQLDATINGEISLNQTGLEQLNFGGEIFVEDGSVFYYKDSFKGLKGYISLDSKGFNPLMDLTAYTDIDDERITIHLYGDMDNLDISLESVSGFSESDILELITWGKRFEELEISSMGFGNQTVSILGSLLENQLENNLKEMPGMGALSLADEIDISGTSALINREENKNFEVTAKKKIGDKTYLNLSYIRSFSLTNHAQIGVEYKLNRHFSVVGNVDDLGKYSVKYRYRYAY